MPTRPASQCGQPRCPHTRPCPIHAPAPWTGSTRRATLPKDWARRRAQVLRRDHWCRCPGCPRCDALSQFGLDRGCAQGASDCDHIDDPHDHSLANLRGLCAQCHAFRSGQQGGRAKVAR